MLSALQSPQEGLHIPMPLMVLVEGTMMPSEAREVILGNLGTGENKLSCPNFFALFKLGPTLIPSYLFISQDGPWRPTGYCGIP